MACMVLPVPRLVTASLQLRHVSKMYVIAANCIHIFKKLCWRCINKTVLDSQKHKILWAYVNCCVSVMPSFNKFLNSSLFTLTFIVHGNGKK